jgi:hypothetical protein
MTTRRRFQSSDGGLGGASSLSNLGLGKTRLIPRSQHFIEKGKLVS